MVRNQSRLSRVLALALLAGAMASFVYAGIGVAPGDPETGWGSTVDCPGYAKQCGNFYGKRCSKTDPGKTCKDANGGCFCRP